MFLLVQPTVEAASAGTAAAAAAAPGAAQPPPDFAPRLFRLAMRKGVHTTVHVGPDPAAAAEEAEDGAEQQDESGSGERSDAAPSQPLPKQHPATLWWQSRHVLLGLHTDTGPDNAG